jgi:hypothetical protein
LSPLLGIFTGGAAVAFAQVPIQHRRMQSLRGLMATATLAKDGASL